MGIPVEVLDKGDVIATVHDLYKYNPDMFEQLFRAFIEYRYGISLETFDKVIHQAVPEEFL